MRIDRIDHFVLTVAFSQTTCDFYSRVLGMSVITFVQGRKAAEPAVGTLASGSSSLPISCKSIG